MEAVSQAWIAAQSQNILPEALLQIQIGVPNTAIQQSASVSGYNYKPGDTTNILTDNAVGSSKPVGIVGIGSVNNSNLLLNEWALDGSVNALVKNANVNSFKDSSDNAVTYDGFIGAVGGTSLTINFSSLVTTEIRGLSVTWSNKYGEYARNVTLTAYNGNTQVATSSVSGNTNIEQFIPVTGFVNFNKIEMTVTSTNTNYDYYRIERIAVGDVITIDKKDIIKFSAETRIDIPNFTLPSSTMKVDIYNRNNMWDPANPIGLYSLLNQHQVGIAYGGFKLAGGDETVVFAAGWLESITTPQNGITATLNFRDPLMFMDKPFDTAHIYDANGDVDTGSTIAYYDGNGDPITLTYADLGQSPLLFIALQAIYQSKLPTNLSGGLLYNISFDSSTDNYSIALPVGFSFSCAEVLQLCANAGLRTLGASGGIATRDYQLGTLPSPIPYTIGKFVSYKYAEYDKQPICTQVIVNDGDSSAGAYPATPTSTDSGQVQYVSNPLIQHTAHAEAVAQWVYSVLGYRDILSGEYRADPRVDVGDKIGVENKYSNDVIIVENIKYDFAGIFKGTYGGRKIG